MQLSSVPYMLHDPPIAIEFYYDIVNSRVHLAPMIWEGYSLWWIRKDVKEMMAFIIRISLSQDGCCFAWDLNL
jgi:hypothetical protein